MSYSHPMKYKTPRSPEYKMLLQAYTQRKTDEGLSTERVTRLTTIAGELFAFLEHQDLLRIQEISQSHLQGFMQYLGNRTHPHHGGGLAPSYLNNYRSGINSVMGFVFDTQTSPFYLQPTPDHGLDIKKIPTVAQIKSLFKACDASLLGSRDKAILALLYGCGLRCGEAYQLAITDVDFGKGAVWVRRSKTGAQRLVPLSATTRDYLEHYRYRVRPLLTCEDHATSAFLISKQGKGISQMGIAARVKQLGQRIGITLNPHALRHAIATHLVDSVPIEDIARFLGHTSLDTTQKYTHLHAEQTKERSVCADN